MVTLVPLHDSGCSSEPEVRRDGHSKEPSEAGDEVLRAGDGVVKNARKRKPGCSSETDGHSKDPGEERDEILRAGEGASKNARKGKSGEPEVWRDGHSKEPAARCPEPEVGLGGDDRSQEPGEAPDREVLDAQDCKEKRRKPSATSTFKKLQLREFGFPVSFSMERFRGLKNVIGIDMYMYKISIALERFEPFMRIRSPIAKIIPLQDLLVLLSTTGVCCSFSRVTNDIIAFLTRTGEMTEDIFYNKKKKSLIISSSSKSDDYTEKKYRSIPIGLLRTEDNTGDPIFASEQVQLLIEFDVVNGIALMRDGTSHRIFDLSTYSLLYKIPDVAHVLSGPNALLVIRQNRKNLLTLVIKMIESGDDIGYINHPTKGKLDHLHLFHEKVLIQKRSKGLQIIDVKKTDQQEIPIGMFEYHALYGRNCFLTFQKDSSQIRNFSGTVIMELEKTLWKSVTKEHRIFSSSDDDTIIYIAESKASELGSVNVCSLGREVSVTTFDPDAEVTCLSYNEDLNEIYLGTSGGRVFVYSV